ncbi:hydroxyacid dehydrogenase [Streptomyces sp. SBT349]|uniref:hydroxyacid dehydrogenase n=1 Tax=Streptomyces sp. SBT349 TaxID=1580539 RepID=UPI00066B0A00|nr:hydroxyacid dehydrogenase [Streptomyces sp. SBT349]
MPDPRPTAALAMSRHAADQLLTGNTLAGLAEVTDLRYPPLLEDLAAPAAADVLADAELLLTGWGCPPIDAGVLERAPRLRAIVHTAGTVRGHVTDACWERGIRVSSAAWANALPVAEYTLAMILLANKRVLEISSEYRAARARLPWDQRLPELGNYGSTVGVLGASLIGRRVLDLLRPFGLRTLLYDPYVAPADAERLGARPAGLDEVFRESDVVSVHVPLLPGTVGLVSRELMASMRPGAMLLNTARGAVVDQDALAELAGAGRIRAVLDVTEPEVLPADHPLWDCENVLISPHIAGSVGNEIRRLGESAVAAARRFAEGLEFAHPVLRERLDITA